MLLRCTKGFETREMGYPQEIAEGTVWYKVGPVIAHGGYECERLVEVADCVYTANYVRVRTERLSECFDQVPVPQCDGLPLPPEQLMNP